jgi:hypothetical protein
MQLCNYHDGLLDCGCGVVLKNQKPDKAVEADRSRRVVAALMRRCCGLVLDNRQELFCGGSLTGLQGDCSAIEPGSTHAQLQRPSAAKVRRQLAASDRRPAEGRT